MKILKCKLCLGEVDIVGNDRTTHKKIKCRNCGYTNANSTEPRGPEVVVIRRRSNSEG